MRIVSLGFPRKGAAMTDNTRNLCWILAGVLAFVASTYVETENFLSFVLVCLSLFFGLLLAVDPDERIPLKVFRVRMVAVLASMLFCFLAPPTMVISTAVVSLILWIGLQMIADKLTALMNEDGMAPPEFR